MFSGVAKNTDEPLGNIGILLLISSVSSIAPPPTGLSLMVSVSDPVSLAPHLPDLRRNGVLLLGDEDKIRAWLPEIAGRVKFDYFEVSYRAWSGKSRTEEYVIAYYPGEAGDR